VSAENVNVHLTHACRDVTVELLVNSMRAHIAECMMPHEQLASKGSCSAVAGHAGQLDVLLRPLLYVSIPLLQLPLHLVF
jgi:hypothetical protein